MSPVQDVGETVSDRLLDRLAACGVDYLFANAGTDSAPVIESLAKAARTGTATPQAMVVPFESTAVSMAHGYYLATGRPQAVMVHVNVGTANALGNLINAAKVRVPMLLMAGRTPLSDSGHRGHRNRNIHWGQEAFDQGGMLREYVKWDHELRHEDPVEMVVDRALQVAMSEPRGPVYLALPREVLAAPATAPARPARLPGSTAPAPDPDALDRLVALLRTAERPLVVTTSAGSEPGGFEALTRFADALAVPVVQHVPLCANLATGHPMDFGLGPSPLLEEADLVLVIESDVPWIPALEDPGRATIVHLGMEPIYEGYPLRCFPADINLRASPARTLDLLCDALSAEAGGSAVARRRQRLQAAQQERRQAMARQDAAEGPLSPAAVNRRIAEVCGEAIYVSEYNLQAPRLPIRRPGSFFGLSPAGYLGWGLGAALGLRLAHPDRLVVAGVGDGTYMFNNPTACHFVGAAHDLPFLTVVFNNERWNAVANAHRFLYPDGDGAASNVLPLSSLSPSPHYERLVEASDGLGLRVETPEDLTAALERAVKAVMVEGRQAVLNVRTQ